MQYIETSRLHTWRPEVLESRTGSPLSPEPFFSRTMLCRLRGEKGALGTRMFFYWYCCLCRAQIPIENVKFVNNFVLSIRSMRSYWALADQEKRKTKNKILPQRSLMNFTHWWREWTSRRIGTSVCYASCTLFVIRLVSTWSTCKKYRTSSHWPSVRLTCESVTVVFFTYFGSKYLKVSVYQSSSLLIQPFTSVI